MLNLATATSVLQLVAANAVSSLLVHASWVDSSIPATAPVTPGAKNPTAISTAGTFTIVGSPAVGFDRNVKFLKVTNTSSSSCFVTIQQFDGTNTSPIYGPVNLLPGYAIEYNTDGDGFKTFDNLGRILVNSPAVTVGVGVAIADSVNTVPGGTVVFSNANNVSFGLLGSTMTASASGAALINVSAGTTSNNLAAVTFSNSNGISFGLNASTVTASFGGQTVSVFSQDADFVTNFTAGQAVLSIQKLSLPMALRATQLVMLADFQGSVVSSDAVTISHGVYALSGGTASLASSASRLVSWPGGGGFTSVSGTRYRSLAVSYSMSPGDYLFAWAISTENSAVVRPFGRFGANVVGGFDGVDTSAFLNGSSLSTVAALPLTIAATNTNYARTGLSPLLQPGAILLGT
jgi:hypothetical protein